jgi:hypothetical protein
MKTLQKIEVGVVVVLILLLCIAGWQNAENQRNDIIGVVQHHADSLKYKRDAAGREHAEKLQTIAGREAIELIYKHTIDSLTQALRIKPKQINNYITVGVKDTGAFTTTTDTVYLKDSSKALHFVYNDRWLRMSGIVGKEAQITYAMTDSLVYVTYTKKKWLLGKKSVYANIYSLNPAVHVTGLESVSIRTERPKRWSAGPYVGYGWNGAVWVPTAGVSVQYALVRW